MYTRAGTIQSLWVHYRYWNQPIQSSCCTDTSGSIISHLTFIQLSKELKHIEFDHCMDQPKTFTLLLKSKIFDFETFSPVHVYPIDIISARSVSNKYHIYCWPYRHSPNVHCLELLAAVIFFILFKYYI